MSSFARALWAVGMLSMGPASLWAQSAAPPPPVPSWPVTTAPARFIIEREPNSPPGVLGTVALNLPEAKWETTPIRVYTDTGQPVGSDLIWTSPGEPAQLVFDSVANAKKYQVYVGSNWPALHLADPQAGVWLETREGDGTTIDKATDMLSAWKKAEGKVVGRALTTGIYEGGNRFGLPRSLLVHMQGWFDLQAPTHLDFALFSSDPAFVIVDGKELVEWPGLHNPGWPPSGPPQGGVDLMAGRHGVDVYNAYVLRPNGPPLMCALGVKGGAFQNWTQLQPGRPFFRAVANYHATGYELQEAPTGNAPELAPPVAFNYEMSRESVIAAPFEVGLIEVHLTCLGAVAGPLTWTFDDGTAAQGLTVNHLFPRPGMRTIRLSVSQDGKDKTLLTQTIYVHSHWAILNGNPYQLYPEHEADIMARDLSAMPASDLVSCSAILGFAEDANDLPKLLPALTPKMGDVKESDLPYIRDVLFPWMANDAIHYPDQILILRAIIDRAGQGNPTPDTVVIGDKCRLALARLLLNSTDQLDDVGKLADAIHPASLSGDETRALAILRADILLARGDVDGARKQYTDLTGSPTGPDLRSSFRRTANIGQARAYIDRKDFSAAEDALNGVAREAPIEKLAPEWALTELHLKQDENLPVEAFLLARRLLPVIPGNDRSELLFRLTTLAFAQNDPDLARKSLSELLEKFPYSAEAAQARQKWPSAP